MGLYTPFMWPLDPALPLIGMGYMRLSTAGDRDEVQAIAADRGGPRAPGRSVPRATGPAALTGAGAIATRDRCGGSSRTAPARRRRGRADHGSAGRREEYRGASIRRPGLRAAEPRRGRRISA